MSHVRENQQRRVNQAVRSGHSGYFYTAAPLRGDVPSPLFAMTAPPKEAPAEGSPAAWRAAWATWHEYVKPTVLQMGSRLGPTGQDAEFQLFVSKVLPDLDPRVLKRFPRPEYWSPDLAAQIQARISRARRMRQAKGAAATHTARIENAHPMQIAVAGVLLYEAGLGAPSMQPKVGQMVEITASARRVAERLGVSYQYVLKIVHEHMADGWIVVPNQVARPADGAGRRGLDEHGRRQGAAAHPSNSYYVYVNERSLLLAQVLHAELGAPAAPEKALLSLVDLEEVSTGEVDGMAARSWMEAIGQLRERIGLSRAFRLLGCLRPIAAGRSSVTVRGRLAPPAAEILRRSGIAMNVHVVTASGAAHHH